MCIGFISTSYNAMMCQKCPDDLTTFKPGSTKCTPKAQVCTSQNIWSFRDRMRCRGRGQFIYEGKCHPCPRGTYQPFTTLKCCLLCGHGKASRIPGAGSPHNCQPRTYLPLVYVTIYILAVGTCDSILAVRTCDSILAVGTCDNMYCTNMHCINMYCINMHCSAYAYYLLLYFAIIQCLVWRTYG